MDGFQVICTIFVTVMTFPDLSGAARESVMSKSDSIAVPTNFETKLECIMNILPDNFQWKFYPLDRKDASNPKAWISLTKSHFRFVPPNEYVETPQKRMSSLTVKASSDKIAGDYQCLAHYGASVVASVPWRVTVAKISAFPPQKKIDVTVVVGNTVNWRCELPLITNPEPYVDYLRNGNYFQPLSSVSKNSLIIPNVTTDHSGSYTCKANNGEEVHSDVLLNLRVLKHGPSEQPKFLIPPKSVYNVTKGDRVFLECAAVGNPVPTVVWEKKNGTISKDRSEMVKGGLIIEKVSSIDNGVYECTYNNSRGTISHSIILNYNEPPTINCLFNSSDVTQGDTLDLDCSVTGTPEPEISWFLNGFVVTNDSKIETDGNKISFRPVEKRHAGNLQIFARNVVGTVYSSIFVTVIPLSTTQENTSDNPVSPTRGSHRGNNSRKPPKHAKMVPPSKPSVSRLSDDSVLLRWTVQHKGLPIQFFKVQYRELGPASSQHEHHNRGKSQKWITNNAVIPPHLTSFQVENLKPDHVYRFRIATVYSNNDNKNSPISEKFHLKKLDFDSRNPIPVPLITNTEIINSTSIKIYWKYDPSPNITVAGFVVNYNLASSAADYMKATVDGEGTNSYVLSHLQPGTVYDIKLQSFTSKSASNYSRTMQARTEDVASTTLPSTRKTTAPPAIIENAGISKLYIIIAGGVLGACGVIFGAIALLIFCRRSKQKKNSARGNRDKAGVDDHHIQADANEYVVGPKTAPRSNGCVTPNRITITANPLADADNKNQNMIEMSCLSSQNNNSTVQPSGSGEDSPTSSRDKINKNREKRIRNKHNVEFSTSGENYV